MGAAKKNQKKRLEDSLERFLRSVREALIDLTTLEVNSILVHNISADHPRDDQEFLKQTCGDLADWFQKNRTDSDVQKPLSDKSLLELRKLCGKGELSNEDERHVTELNSEAADCLDHKIDLTDDVLRYKRAEYRRHLRYLQKYVELHSSDKWNWTDGMLEGREHNQLRKLWEVVGTDFVYSQTVVGLDGDIVSRVNQQLFDSAHKMAKNNAEALIRFHSRNVEAGTNYRNNLMETFVQIIRAVLGGL